MQNKNKIFGVCIQKNIAKMGTNLDDDITNEIENKDISKDLKPVQTYPLYVAEDTIVRQCASILLHHLRTFSYVPWFTALLWKKPEIVILGMLSYYGIRFNIPQWTERIRQFLRYAHSPNYRFIKAQTASFSYDKNYLYCGHPHGVLVEGIQNTVARSQPLAADTIIAVMFDDRPDIYMSVAPAMFYIPLHSESILDSRLIGPSAKEIKTALEDKKSVFLAPGGFAESTYTNYAEDKEVMFLRGRTGFIHIAIQTGVDIVPIYQFGINAAYRLTTFCPGLSRHQRAILSQKYNIPLYIFWGAYGTSVPLVDDIVTVTFDPFPTNKYTLDQVEEAHYDYCVYLKKCFDSHKYLSKHTKNSEMVFAGRDHLPGKL